MSSQVHQVLHKLTPYETIEKIFTSPLKIFLMRCKLCLTAVFNPNCIFHYNHVFVFFAALQGRCNREKPPCKYFHPPQHLKDQLLINGRNHLALKNALMQQMGMAPPAPTPTIMPSTLQPMVSQHLLINVLSRNVRNKTCRST